MVAMVAVVVWALGQWAAGPLTFAVQRQRAAAAADATALAAVGWGDDVARTVAALNGAVVVWSERIDTGVGSTVEVIVSVAGVRARARASDVG